MLKDKLAERLVAEENDLCAMHERAKKLAELLQDALPPGFKTSCDISVRTGSVDIEVVWNKNEVYRTSVFTVHSEAMLDSLDENWRYIIKVVERKKIQHLLRFLVLCKNDWFGKSPVDRDGVFSGCINSYPLAINTPLDRSRRY